MSRSPRRRRGRTYQPLPARRSSAWIARLLVVGGRPPPDRRLARAPRREPLTQSVSSISVRRWSSELHELRRRGHQVEVIGLDVVEEPELGVRRKQAGRLERRCKGPRLDERDVMVLGLVHQVHVSADAVEVADGRDGVDEGEGTRGQRSDRVLRHLQGRRGEHVVDRTRRVGLERRAEGGIGSGPLGRQDRLAQGLVEQTPIAVIVDLVEKEAQVDLARQRSRRPRHRRSIGGSVGVGGDGRQVGCRIGERAEGIHVSNLRADPRIAGCQQRK